MLKWGNREEFNTGIYTEIHAGLRKTKKEYCDTGGLGTGRSRYCPQPGGEGEQAALEPRRSAS